jgi:hypothetical protein
MIISYYSPVKDKPGLKDTENHHTVHTVHTVQKLDRFSPKSLKYMINIWNKVCQPQEKIDANSTNMYSNLNNALKLYVKGPNKYWLWSGVIEKLAEKKYINNTKVLAKIKRDLRTICKRELKPEKPESWYKNPKTWLSNWDIQNVMTQYAQNKSYHYEFMGVFPIDFAVMSQSGMCMYSSICNINIKSCLKRGKSFIGLITNLDRHDQSGSHWTSTFIVIDPKLKTYGAFYYDSTGSPIPSYLLTFLKNVKEQCLNLHPDKEFLINQNKKQHQRKNTECGIFSMLYQIRWLNKHIIKKDMTTFHEILANPNIDDEHMLTIRDYLFRPNTKLELKKLGFSV